MRYSISLLILGVLAGTIIMHTIQGKALEKLYWEKENLKVELYETREQLKKIQEQHKSLLPALIEKIELEITMEEDSFVEPDLKLRIYDLVKEVLGQEIQTLPYPLLFNLLHERIVQVENKQFRLEVEAIIIGKTLVYYLKVKKISAEDLP